jgi:hypothetical protein
MSVRGQYYPNNKEVAAGDRKLFLQVESLTERGLQLAKAEVARLIKEEMMKMVSLIEKFYLKINLHVFFFSKIQLYNLSIVDVIKLFNLNDFCFGLMNFVFSSFSSMFCKIEFCLSFLFLFWFCLYIVHS